MVYFKKGLCHHRFSFWKNDWLKGLVEHIKNNFLLIP